MKQFVARFERTAYKVPMYPCSYPPRWKKSNISQINVPGELMLYLLLHVAKYFTRTGRQESLMPVLS